MAPLVLVTMIRQVGNIYMNIHHTFIVLLQSQTSLSRTQIHGELL